MIIAEEFSTIQGEGKYLGVPSHFIRTMGCNLRCAWKGLNGGIVKCDTPYTSWKMELDEATKFDIKKTIKYLEDTNIKHVVITGGEPCLQKDLQDIVKIFIEFGYKVTIETNGTIFQKLPRMTFLSISPKLRSSYASPIDSIENKIHSKNNDFDDSLPMWIVSNRYQLKFVVNDDTEGDISEIKRIQNQLFIPNDKIWIMPQGITVEQLQKNSKRIFKYCVKNGYNFSPRMHIDIFGNKRGI